MNAELLSPTLAQVEPVVFIVDDDEAVREALTLVVSMRGWTARPCASAEEFLSQYAGQSQACLLLDLAMQGMNGAELLEALHCQSKELPAIVVTAHHDHALARRALEAGAVAIVGKPFKNAKLTALMESALGMPS